MRDLLPRARAGYCAPTMRIPIASRESLLLLCLASSLVLGSVGCSSPELTCGAHTMLVGNQCVGILPTSDGGQGQDATDLGPREDPPADHARGDLGETAARCSGSGCPDHRWARPGWPGRPRARQDRRWPARCAGGRRPLPCRLRQRLQGHGALSVRHDPHGRPGGGALCRGLRRPDGRVHRDR